MNNIHEIGKVVEEVFYLYVVSTQSPVFKCIFDIQYISTVQNYYHIDLMMLDL